MPKSADYIYLFFLQSKVEVIAYQQLEVIQLVYHWIIVVFIHHVYPDKMNQRDDMFDELTHRSTFQNDRPQELRYSIMN